MSVYVDEITKYPHVKGRAARWGNQWSHMYCDPESMEEMHAIASKLGLRQHFQNRAGFPHYDMIPTKRTQALKLGVIFKSLRQHLKEKIAQEMQANVRAKWRASINV